MVTRTSYVIHFWDRRYGGETHLKEYFLERIKEFPQGAPVRVTLEVTTKKKSQASKRAKAGWATRRANESQRKKKDTGYF